MESTPPVSPSRARSDRRTHSSRSSKSGSRVLRWLVISVIVLAAAGGFWRLRGRAAYHQWRNERMLDRAEGFLKDGRLAEASVAARRMLAADPSNIRAVMVMAGIADRLGVPDAIRWRQRLVELEPGNTSRLLALALTAIQVRDFAAAKEALDKVPSAARDEVSFHELSGVFEFSSGGHVEAVKHFKRALEIGPADDQKRLNLARAKLFALDAQAIEEGRKELMAIPETSTNYPGALSLLVNDAIRKTNWANARQLAAKLSAVTNAPAAERLIHLGLLQRFDPPAFTNELRRVQGTFLGNPNDLTTLLTWMNTHGMPNQALAWVRSLPPEKFSTAGPGMAVAELYIAVRDWLGLKGWLQTADWGIYQPLRRAYEALATSKLATDDSSAGIVAGLWSKSVEEAGDQPFVLELLLQLASGWNMPAQREQTIWALANIPSRADKALAGLSLMYQQQENAIGLYNVSKKLLERNPANLNAKNDFVWLGLVLKLDRPELFKMSEELITQAPGNATFVATAAFALHRQNRTREAIEKMAALPESELARPEMSFVYGYLLAKAGDRNPAKAYLKRAEKARLLPEEYKLLLEGREAAR